MRSFSRAGSIAILFALLIFPLTLSRSSAGTGNAMNTATLLTRLSNALGGTGNIEKIRNVYFSWDSLTANFGGPILQRWTTHDVVHEWLTSDGNDRVEMRSSAGQSGPVLQVLSVPPRIPSCTTGTPVGWILVGDQGWPSGNSTGEMQGPDLERQISHVYWTTFAFLTGRAFPGKVSYKAISGASDYLLKMDPVGGEPIRAYLNPKTFLPDKVEFGDGPRERIAVFTDWKIFHGVRFPYTMTMRYGTDGITMQAVETLAQVRMNVTLSPNMFKQPTPAL